MDRVTLQVPVSKDIKIAAQERAESMGFSSLQEAVRVFLSKLSAGALDIGFEEKEVQLSKKAIKRYDKMTEDIESGKVKTYSFDSVDEMMKQLNS